MVNPADTLHQLRAADEELRLRAVRSLRGQTLSEASPLLFLAMADENWRVRKEAVEVFVAMEPEELHIEKLLELFRSEENAGLCNSAAEAIIRLGERTVEPLIRLAGDSDGDVRKFVIDAMGAIGSSRFFPILRATLKDPDHNVAAAAAEQLGVFGDNAAIQDLINALVSNSSLLFRFSALAALGKLNAHGAVPEEIIALAGEDILRKGVYVCLGSIGDEASCPILQAGFQETRKSSRAAAVVSWYRIYTRSAAMVRLDLESAVRRLSGTAVVAQLIELFPTGEIYLAEALTVLFGIIGDSRTVPALLQACADERLSAQALESLKMLGVAGLDAMLADYPPADDASRAAICTLVGELQYGAASSIICAGVHDSSPAVRIAAADALGDIGSHASLEALIAALTDDDVWVQCAVLRNIERIDRSRLYPHLETLFVHADGILMLTCIELLERIGSPDALALVRSALAHRDVEIAATAAVILERRENKGAA